MNMYDKASGGEHLYATHQYVEKWVLIEAVSIERVYAATFEHSVTFYSKFYLRTIIRYTCLLVLYYYVIHWIA